MTNSRILKKFNLPVPAEQSGRSVVNNLYTNVGGIKMVKFISKKLPQLQTPCSVCY